MEPQVEKVIKQVIKRRDCTEKEAIAYMLKVAAGRLSALYRYDETLPDGKASKGVFELKGRKKPAKKTPLIPPAKKVAKKVAKVEAAE